MNETHPIKPIFLIVGGLFFSIIIVLSIITLLMSKSNNQKSSQKKPSDITTSTSLVPSINTPSKPLLITPTGTGGMDELPKKVENEALQKQNLKKQLPINESNFSIEFDYGSDKFIVQLREPKPTSIDEFKLWLSNYFPLIPITKFLLK